MGFFVEVRGHDLGNQGLQHIGKEEEQEATQQSCKGTKHILHMIVLVVFGVEAADEKRNEESHAQEAPQRLLQHSTQQLAWFEISSTTERVMMPTVRQLQHSTFQYVCRIGLCETSSPS